MQFIYMLNVEIENVLEHTHKCIYSNDHHHNIHISETNLISIKICLFYGILLKFKRRRETHKAKSIGFVGGSNHCVLRAVLCKKEFNVRDFIKNSCNPFS